MGEKTFKPKPGEEIIIRVPKKKKPDATALAPSARRKGILKTRKPDDFLPRRLKKGGYVNFWDLGQLWNGAAWATVSYNYFAGRDFEIVYQPVTNNYAIQHQAAKLDLTGRQILIDRIKEIPLADWKTNYRKIEYSDAAKYGLYVVTDGYHELRPDYTKWTAQGLKVETENFSLSSPRGLCLSLSLGSGYKITETEDFAGEPVAVDFRRGADVFLIPAIHETTGFTRPGTTLEYLYTYYVLASRELYLEANFFNPDFNVNGAALAPIALDALFFNKSQPEARRYVADTVTGAGGETSPSPFPLTLTEIFMSQATATGAGSFFFTDIGTLHAVVRQGAKTYYVWRESYNGESDFGVLYNTSVSLS